MEVHTGTTPSTTISMQLTGMFCFITVSCVKTAQDDDTTRQNTTLSCRKSKKHNNCSTTYTFTSLSDGVSVLIEFSHNLKKCQECNVDLGKQAVGWETKKCLVCPY